MLFAAPSVDVTAQVIAALKAKAPAARGGGGKAHLERGGRDAVRDAGAAWQRVVELGGWPVPPYSVPITTAPRGTTLMPCAKQSR